MAHTVFTDFTTVIVAPWLQDVDSVTYTNFGNGTSYTGNLTLAATKTITLTGSTSGTVVIAAPATSTGTITLPNASSVLPIFGQQITFSGPTTARTVTLPDASITVARTDAAQSFTGLQTFSTGITSTAASNSFGATVFSGNITSSGNPSLNIGTGALTAGALQGAVDATSYATKALYLSNAANTKAFNTYVNNSTGALVTSLYNGSSWVDNAMTLDASGNLGLGVTPSGWGANYKVFQIPSGSLHSYSTTVTTLNQGAYDSGIAAWKYLVSGSAIGRYDINSGIHYWYTAPSGTAGNAITWTTAMTLDASGNLIVPAAYSVTTASAANCYVETTGQFKRSTSALKYKTDVRDLESINVDLIRPVRYKSACAGDDQTKDHFGVIADEVDVAGIKELVMYGENGEVEGFQYDRLAVVLLKEIQSLRTRLAALEESLP